MSHTAAMIELHSNFTLQGSKQVEDGVRPTNHALDETVEITQGFNEWFETGFYIFTSTDTKYGWQYVGNHIWEFNFGVGIGVTQATDHLLVKMIIGRRLNT